MAERRRAMLVALRAVTRAGNPCEFGYHLSQQLGRAGTQLPKPIPDTPEMWSIFGERRLVKDTPTLLERTETPFTKAGKRYITKLIGKSEALQNPKDWDMTDSDLLRINYLEGKLVEYPKRIKELEQIISNLSSQLKDYIG